MNSSNKSDRSVKINKTEKTDSQDIPNDQDNFATIPITSKQRATLRGMANGEQSILQIGKGGIGKAFEKQVRDALEARELIKISVLETSPVDAKQACGIICDKTNAVPVQVIGNKFVIYKRAREKENRKISEKL